MGAEEGQARVAVDSSGAAGVTVIVMELGTATGPAWVSSRDTLGTAVQALVAVNTTLNSPVAMNTTSAEEGAPKLSTVAAKELAGPCIAHHSPG